MHCFTKLVSSFTSWTYFDLQIPEHFISVYYIISLMNKWGRYIISKDLIARFPMDFYTLEHVFLPQPYIDVSNWLIYILPKLQTFEIIFPKTH